MHKNILSLFPLLTHYPDLVYLDSAATALKPRPVMEAETEYATRYGTNAVRGLYPLAESTSAFVDRTREKIAQFIHCTPEEIIFTHGTTDGINMMAQSLANSFHFQEGKVLASMDMHHSLALPLENLSRKKLWDFDILPINQDGFLDTEAALTKVTPDTHVLFLTLVSNVYGVIQDLHNFLQKVRIINPEIFILIDAAQAVAHIPLDVQALDTDALLFSGHKLYGPTGIGVCYLRKTWQAKLAPGVFGGGMVIDTETSPMRWKQGPEKFEAGTLPLSQIFGLKAAILFIESMGYENIRSHEHMLLEYSIQKLTAAFRSDITILGTGKREKKIGLLSFTLTGVHPHDIATLLGEQNICVRAGVHCASFLHRALALPATTRISFGIYTTKKDMDIFTETLKEIFKKLKR